MVVKAEAICPNCLNTDGYTIPIQYNSGSKDFRCNNCNKAYVEDNSGFLVSKKY
ncbi:Uncharacterised protein [uncultured archaeon]|nr:Uncharacterised protein [uncultured archaeon]